MKKLILTNLGAVNILIVDLMAPKNINFFWCLGSILGVTLGFQIVTGILISIHYFNYSGFSFFSITNIHYNINEG